MTSIRNRRIPVVVVNQDDGPTEAVPTYTEIAEDTNSPAAFATRIDTLREAFPQVAAATVSIPITHYPEQWYRQRINNQAIRELKVGKDDVVLDACREARDLQASVVDSFFACIANRNEEMMSSFVSSGLISPECPNEKGETPLLAAVRAANPRMVRTLLNLGVEVNGYGGAVVRIPTPDIDHKPRDGTAQRTALQHAAFLGNLALVKFLMEDCGADDSLIAPDGNLALRLAADNGHREVVAYLPARRGGAWTRWRVAHAREMRLAKKAAMAVVAVVVFFGYDVPKFFVYTIPRDIWKKRAKIGRWCIRQVTEFPDRVVRGTKKIGRGIKKLGKAVKEIPEVVRQIAAATWRAVCRIPGALEIVAMWIWRGIQSVGSATARIAGRLLSFLHTAVSAVMDFFRTITLKDVKDGFVALMRSIFVELPQAVWGFLERFGIVTYEAIRKVFGWLGTCVWYLCYGVWWLLRWFPKKLWQILSAFGRSLKKGFREVLVWFDPKRV